MSLPSALREGLERSASPAGRARRASLARVLPGDWESPPDPAETQALDLLAGGTRSILVTGQQAGLLLGPFLLLSKCLALLALARRVEQAGQPRPLTLFWLEGNDHDWREAARPGRPLPEDWSAPCPVEAEGRPVGRVEPDSGWWAEQRTPLRPLLDSLDPGLAGHVEAAWRGGLCGHTRRLLRALFAEQGLLILDPSTPALRRLAAPFLDRLQEEGSALAQDLLDQTETLRQAGARTPVRVDDRPPCFVEDVDGLRRRLEPGERRPGEECSPTALTRPLLQDWLLEPAAALLGPSEHAYMAQAARARRRLGLIEPLPLPRPTLQLARREDWIRLRDAGLDPWLPPQPGQVWPEDWLQGLEGGGELSSSLTRLESAGAELLGLCAVGGRAELAGLGKRQEALLEQLRAALWTAHKARHKEQLRGLHALAAWQDGAAGPQERRVNALALLSRMGGLPVLEGLLRELDPLQPVQQRFLCDPRTGEALAAS